MTDRPHAWHTCPSCADGDPWACHANPETFEHRPDRVHRPGCPFCEIVDCNAPAEILGQWKGAWGTETMAITPLRPVVPGHILVLPKTHVVDFTMGAQVFSDVASRASILAHKMGFQANLITSAGRAATQTVLHLHVHLVPRCEGDGLALPWTNQH